jgi:hypothetical protein
MIALFSRALRKNHALVPKAAFGMAHEATVAVRSTALRPTPGMEIGKLAR